MPGIVQLMEWPDFGNFEDSQANLQRNDHTRRPTHVPSSQGLTGKV